MTHKLKKELTAAFQAPPPRRKAALLRRFPYPRATGAAVFLTQLGYLRKRFWLFSALAALLMAWSAKAASLSGSTLATLSAMLPLLAVLGVTELGRSTSCRMAELEAGCKFSLGKLLLVRLSLVGSFHFLLLLLLVVLLSGGSGYGLLRFSLYGTLPFLLCSAISLFLLNRLPAAEILPICAGTAGTVCAAVLLLSSQVWALYAQRYTALWVIAFCVVLAVLAWESHLFIKRRECLEWNS